MNHAYVAAEKAMKAAKAHKGGALAGWYRLMGRNSYTIDPRRPAPDARDEEREALRAEARRLAEALITDGVATRHDLTVRGWIL